MTTSDKITHAMDVVFLIGIIALVYFFMRADRDHERELSALQATVQELQGKVIALEGKSGTPSATKPGQ
jgi:hypothetical protein